MTEPAFQLQDQPIGECRFGRPEDRLHFVRLWQEFLTEAHEAGSNMLPDDHNLYLFWDYFDAYTTGKLAGAVVFWTPTEGMEPVGVAMAGADYHEPFWHLDREGGRWAKLWGVYVQPSYRGSRVGLEMELFGESRLLRQGFRWVSSSVRTGNELGAANWQHWNEARGVQGVETIIVARLGERQENRHER